ncbi:MAG: rod shape-determining protein MreC [Gallionellaceae bacterium]|nr:MAG: rod shape-determining protein MreC [Gallionellaceae bacterium]
MDSTRSFRFFNRGPSAVVRLVFFAVLSLLLLFVDARFKYLESTRTVVFILIYPLQRLTTLPGMMWQHIGTYIETQNRLIQENTRLREQHSVDAAQLNLLQVVQAENTQLHNLLEVQQRVSYPMQMAEIVYVERDIFKRKLFVSKGAQANVRPGQVVMDDMGIVGQVTRVYPWLSEVTLVTDKDHAVPVQVLRNGIRAVVFGSGDIGELALRYMPVSADIQTGDVLVTSGIDGTYPAGLPVAKVIKIERDPAYPFARIMCAPMAGVDRHRYLLIVSGLPELPPRPDPGATADDKTKNANKQKVP